MDKSKKLRVQRNRIRDLYDGRNQSMDLDTLSPVIAKSQPRLNSSQRRRIQAIYSPRALYSLGEETIVVPCRWKQDGWKLINKSSEQMHLNHPNKRNAYNHRETEANLNISLSSKTSNRFDFPDKTR
jgi:hypothetical protein